MLKCLRRDDQAVLALFTSTRVEMSMIEEDFGSDTDDEDYKPDHVEVSEEENSGDEEDALHGEEDGNRKGKKKQANGKGKSRGGMFADEEKVNLGDWKKEVNEEKDKKRLDDLWADFKKDTNSSKPTKVLKPSNGGFSSLFDSPVNEAKSKDVTPKTNRLSSLFDVSSDPKKR